MEDRLCVRKFWRNNSETHAIFSRETTTVTLIIALLLPLCCGQSVEMRLPCESGEKHLIVSFMAEDLTSLSGFLGHAWVFTLAYNKSEDCRTVQNLSASWNLCHFANCTVTNSSESSTGKNASLPTVHMTESSSPMFTSHLDPTFITHSNSTIYATKSVLIQESSRAAIVSTGSPTPTTAITDHFVSTVGVSVVSSESLLMITPTPLPTKAIDASQSSVSAAIEATVESILSPALTTSSVPPVTEAMQPSPSSSPSNIDDILPRNVSGNGSEAVESFNSFAQSIRGVLDTETSGVSFMDAVEIFSYLSNILNVVQDSNLPDLENGTSFGSNFIQLVDKVALSVDVGEGETVQFAGDELDVTVQNINTEMFADERLEHSFGVDSHTISLPNSLFSMIGQENVKIASVLYDDLSNILQTEDAMRLGTPVLSSTLGCEDGNSNCTNSLEFIEDGVTVIFEHKDASPGEGACVFWDLTNNLWSRRGCSRMANQSNTTHTTCRCQHLTHFAVLFDLGVSTPPSKRDLIALEILSYVGYAISFVFITAMIVIFASFKSLWNLRTYIHINLCVNLLIAQFVVLIGGDSQRPFVKSMQLCAATAVIIQYFYHVMFMWMLMEAIILYIKLVRAFGQENKWQYIIFTILSYGLPFAYLFISVPVGFGRRKEWSYGVDNARVNQTDLHSCWLTVSDHFIFAFIVPVLLIILVNCFIFVVVMAIITKKLQQSQENVKVKKIRTWLRSAASLIVILGIGWVVGIFMFHPVMYYVAVIYYGFQGVFIFVLFVLLSSKVRSTIWKKWRTFAQNHSTSSDLNSSRQGKRSIISLLLFRSSGKLSKSSNSKSNSGEKEHPGKTHNGIELGTFGGRLHKPCGSEVDDADKLTKSIVAEEDNNLYDKIENDKESKPNDDEKSCESTFQDKETGHDSCVMHFD